jgi:UDP-N-acetyl-D-mannosaminuronic acid transferase (WecB/TagA/CpsF family)
MKCLIHLIVILSIVKKGKKMTEEEFKKALDQVVLNGINQVGAGVVLGSLAVVTRFTEVVYDMDLVKQLETNATQKTTTKEKKKL